MSAYINPPTKIPLFLKIGIWISKKVTGKDLLPPKLLAWYPKAAIGSGILESLVAHGSKDLDSRILKLIRIQCSLSASCPFCIDMNSFDYALDNITEEELAVLQGELDLKQVTTFSIREKLAIEYSKGISNTPVSFAPTLIHELKEHFTEREIVIMATTSAQVNYWARVIAALGVPPAGFSNHLTLQTTFH